MPPLCPTESDFMSLISPIGSMFFFSNVMREACQWLSCVCVSGCQFALNIIDSLTSVSGWARRCDEFFRGSGPPSESQTDSYEGEDAYMMCKQTMKECSCSSTRNTNRFINVFRSERTPDLYSSCVC